MIVIAVQNQNANPRPAEIQLYLNAIKALYKISAFIGTGLSRGGQDWDWFIGNAESQLAEMAALLIASSEGPVTDEPGIAGSWSPAWFSANNVYYWAACGTLDSFYNANSLSVLPRYQSLKAVAPNLAFMDTWIGAGHGDPVWSDFFNPAWVSPTQGKSIYTFAASLGVPVPSTTSTTSSTTTLAPTTVAPKTTTTTTTTTSSTTTTSTTLKYVISVTLTYSDGSTQVLPA